MQIEKIFCKLRLLLMWWDSSVMGFIRKYLSADGLLNIVKHGLRREQFKKIKNTTYSWEDCIMSGLAVFGFKMPSLLQFEKSKADEPFIRRNLNLIDKTLRKSFTMRPGPYKADCGEWLLFFFV